MEGIRETHLFFDECSVLTKELWEYLELSIKPKSELKFRNPGHSPYQERLDMDEYHKWNENK